MTTPTDISAEQLRLLNEQWSHAKVISVEGTHYASNALLTQFKNLANTLAAQNADLRREVERLKAALKHSKAGLFEAADKFCVIHHSLPKGQLKDDARIYWNRIEHFERLMKEAMNPPTQEPGE